MEDSNRYQAKFALAAGFVAACLAVIGAFLPPTNLRWFVWGATAGLVLMLVFFLIKRVKGGEVTPQQARQNVKTRRKWITLSAPFGIGLGLACALFFPDQGWLFIGFACGFLGLPVLLIVQALLQPGNPKPRERRFPLEPER